MRKDVKLGLAVGGVLLAVLVVYVLVVPGNNASQQGAEVTIEGASDAFASGDAASGATGETSSAGAVTNRDVSKGADNGATANARGSAGQDQQLSNSGASADANRGKAADSAAAGADANKPSGETAGGGWNWDALVNGTEKVPSMNAGADVPANGGNAISVPVNGAETQQTTAADQAQAAPVPMPAPVETSVPRQNVLAGGSSDNAPGGDAGASTDNAITASARQHVVKSGENYSKIAQAIYGNAKYYLDIEQANPNIDPTRLKPGMTINLPAIDTTAKPAAAPAAVAQQQPAPAQQQPALDPKSEYKVQPNDSLYTISLRLYGKADRVEKIYELNRTTIGDDNARLKVGTVLKLPEAPTQGAAPAPQAQGTVATSR